jgi:hypothetical protein
VRTELGAGQDAMLLCSRCGKAFGEEPRDAEAPPREPRVEPG